MIYAVEFTSASAKQIRKLPRPARERLLVTVVRAAHRREVYR